MSLEEAEAEVLSWLDPGRDPRIEWRQYVWGPDLAEHGYWDDRFPAEYQDQYARGDPTDLETLGSPLVVVVASTLAWDDDHMFAPARETSERHLIMAAFNALTGERHVSTEVWDDQQLPEILNAMEVPRVEYEPEARVTVTPIAKVRSATQTAMSATVAPTPSPTPTLTPVPESAGLTWANMPAALEATFRAYPLAPGSQWVWHETGEHNQILQEAGILTETVEAAWVEGDLAIVRSRTERHELKPPSPFAMPQPKIEDGTATRFVNPGVIVGRREDLKEAGFLLTRMDENCLHMAETPLGFDGISVEPSIGLLPGGWGPTCVRNGPLRVTTAVGQFSDCWDISVIGGAGLGAIRTFCPGVGTARFSTSYATGMRGGMIRYELLRWHRAELPQR